MSMDNSINTNDNSHKMIINGCNVTIRFEEEHNARTENAIMDILMESFEDRIRLDNR